MEKKGDTEQHSRVFSFRSWRRSSRRHITPMCSLEKTWLRESTWQKLECRWAQRHFQSYT